MKHLPYLCICKPSDLFQQVVSFPLTTVFKAKEFYDLPNQILKLEALKSGDTTKEQGGLREPINGKERIVKKNTSCSWETPGN